MTDEASPSQVRDLQKWYQAAQSDLLNLAAQHLVFSDAEKVLAAFATRLPGCPAKDESKFRQWAEESVSDAARLMALFRELYLEHQALVFEAIKNGLGPVFRNDSDFWRTVDPQTGVLMTANETASELAGESWIKVLEKLHQWKPGRAKITTWIYKIAYQTARNHMRLRMRRSKRESYTTVDDLIMQERKSLTLSE